uniref:hypothetical protein n=1 Tax=Candidatus Electronema sp. TaxID=2698783 RepID=UPI004055AC15
TKPPANLTLRMRAHGVAGPLTLSKFQQEKLEMPVCYLRRGLLGPRGETASGSPSIKMNYANPSQSHNTRYCTGISSFSCWNLDSVNGPATP